MVAEGNKVWRTRVCHKFQDRLGIAWLTIPTEKKPSKNKNKGKAASGNAPVHGPPGSSSTTDTPSESLEALSITAKDSRLLQLPLELRGKIYAHLLDTRVTSPSKPFAYRPLVRDGKLRLKATSPPFQLHTAILRVNKQVQIESANTLYSSNLFIRLNLYNDDVYWTQSLLEGTKMGFVCSNPDLVSKLTRHALDVKIVQDRSKRLRCQVVFPAIYLPRFTTFLQTMCDALPRWGKEHAIHLDLRHKYRSGPAENERLLLEPWRRLHGLSAVVVGTDIIPSAYAKSLQTAMTGEFEPWSWLKSATNMKDMGSEEFKKGQWGDARDHYRNTLSILESVFQSARQGRLLSTMPPKFGHAINKLRFQCELNLALCCLKLKTHWAEALLAADNAIDLADDNEMNRVWEACAPKVPANDKSDYSAVDRSKARFRRGSIMIELGEYGYAASDLEDALKENPEDAIIQSAFETAKEKYDPTARHGAVVSRLWGFQRPRAPRW